METETVSETQVELRDKIIRWLNKPGNIQRAIGIPKRFERAEVEHPEPVHTNGFLLMGYPGVGKTWIGTATLTSWVRARMMELIPSGEFDLRRWLNPNHVDEVLRTVGRFAKAAEIVAEMRSTFSQSTVDGERKVLNRYGFCPFLMIDDLGAEQASEYSREKIELLLDQRRDFFRPTIITTNYDLSEFTQRNPRIGSRLSGMKKITLRGKDRRIEEGA